MEAEVGEHAGASRGERAPDRRAAQRNGYRWREWDTRVGTIELAIPKVRPGPSYFPSFLEARRRAERALCAVVAQAYVEGVSTRKVEDVAAQMGITSLSTSQVSRLCGELDELVEAWRTRPLADGPYPLTSALIATAVNGAIWTKFLRNLVARGLHGVRLVTSDAHGGIQQAISAVLAGASWQRWPTHFYGQPAGHRGRPRPAAGGLTGAHDLRSGAPRGRLGPTRPGGRPARRARLC